MTAKERFSKLIECLRDDGGITAVDCGQGSFLLVANDSLQPLAFVPSDEWLNHSNTAHAAAKKVGFIQ